MSQFQTVEQLQAEIGRLRAVGMKAYAEGFDDAWASNSGTAYYNLERDECWKRSEARAALQPKEGQ